MKSHGSRKISKRRLTTIRWPASRFSARSVRPTLAIGPFRRRLRQVARRVGADDSHWEQGKADRENRNSPDWSPFVEFPRREAMAVGRIGGDGEKTAMISESRLASVLTDHRPSRLQCRCDALRLAVAGSASTMPSLRPSRLHRGCVGPLQAARPHGITDGRFTTAEQLAGVGVNELMS